MSILHTKIKRTILSITTFNLFVTVEISNFHHDRTEPDFEFVSELKPERILVRDQFGIKFGSVRFVFVRS